jgi:hypothetical protein
MTTVNVTTQENKVEVTSGGTTVNVASSTVATVEAVTAGPRGPVGPSGLEVDSTAKVSGSVVYYDGSEFKADATWTTSTLTFGGNF